MARLAGWAMDARAGVLLVLVHAEWALDARAGPIVATKGAIRARRACLTRLAQSVPLTGHILERVGRTCRTATTKDAPRPPDRQQAALARGARGDRLACRVPLALRSLERPLRASLTAPRVATATAYAGLSGGARHAWLARPVP